jgi:hypothetical protein
VFVCIEGVRPRVFYAEGSWIGCSQDRILTAGTTRILPLVNPAEDGGQRQRPKGVVIDRSEREG